MQDERREALKAMLVARSLLLGEFTLSSGERSRVYLDARLSSTSARGMTLIGPLFLALLRAEGLWKPDAIIGPSVGADPLLGAISYASALEDDPVDHLIVRKEPKGHGTGSWLVGRTEGVRQVVLVEDTWTTGASSLRAVEAAQAAGLLVTGAVALVDREQGARHKLAPIPCASLFTLRELLEAKGVTP